MKLLVFVLIIGAFFWDLPESNGQAEESAIAGDWYSEEMDQSLLRIAKNKEGAWVGTIVKSADEKKAGKTILTQVKFNPEKNQWAARLTTASGMKLNSLISLVDGKLKLSASKLLITKTIMWSRP